MKYSYDVQLRALTTLSVDLHKEMELAALSIMLSLINVAVWFASRPGMLRLMMFMFFFCFLSFFYMKSSSFQSTWLR